MTAVEPLRRNPYVGPRAFQHGEKLYGREREVQRLVNLLIAERVVLLYSPSGAGKTSLIHAALLDALRREEFDVLPVMRVNQELPPKLVLPPQGNRYILSALMSLEEALPREQQLPISELAGMDFSAYLERRAVNSNQPDSQVLIFDQFEEILVVDPANQAAKTAFFAQIGAVLRDRSRWALFSMREDYRAGLDPYVRPIPTRLSNTFRLDFLDAVRACTAVQAPAREAGVDFTDAAAQKLIDDLRCIRVQLPDGSTVEQLGPYVEPVQLQVVCLRLWENLPPGAQEIVPEDVAAVGNVDQALSGYYAERVAVIARETGVPERAIREWVDQQLITEYGLRGQVLQGRERSQGLDNRAIQRLVNAHLVRAEERHGAIWFELAHDRLIDPIRTNNAAWRDANLNPLQRQAAHWDAQNRPDTLLLSGQLLREAERWARQQADTLTPIERDFVTASRKALDSVEREQKARRIRWLAIVASMVSAIVILALAVAVFYYGQARAELSKTKAAEATAQAERARAEAEAVKANEAQATAKAEQSRAEAAAALAAQAEANARAQRSLAEEQERRATSRELAAAANNNIAIDPERSVLLALHAVTETYAVDQTVLSDSADALYRAVRASHLAFTLQHDKPVNTLAWNADGTRLAMADSYGELKVWDVAQRQAVSVLGQVADVIALVWSPDGQRLATTHWDSRAIIWDVASGRQLRAFEHEALINGVAWNRTGTRLATVGEDGVAIIWDANSGKRILTLPPLAGEERNLTSVAWSPDGKSLVTGERQGFARIWDVTNENSSRVVRRLKHNAEVTAVDWSSDGLTLATASLDRTAKMWDTRSGDELFTLSHPTEVTKIAFSRDGRQVATLSAENTARVWDVATGSETRTLVGHGDEVSGIAWNHDGSLLATASWDQTVKVWHTAPNKDLLTLDQTVGANAVAWSPDGTRLITSGYGELAVWDAATGQKLSALNQPVPQVNDQSRPAVGTPVYSTDNVTSVALSPDGTRLATAAFEGSAVLWELESRRTTPILGELPHILNIAWSADSQRLAAVSDDGSIRIWDVRSNQETRPLQGKAATAASVAWSPDGQHLAVAGKDGSVSIWNLDSGTMKLELPRQSAALVSLAWSPDGTRLVGLTELGALKMWNASSGQELALPSHSPGDTFHFVAWNSDSSLLVAANRDGTIKVWDMAANQERLAMSQPGGIFALAFSPDGKKLATASADGRIEVFPIHIEDMLQVARSRVTRNLTAAECQRYLHQPQCPAAP